MSLLTFAVDDTTIGGRGSPNPISPGSDTNDWNQIAGTQTPSYASGQIVLTYNGSSALGVWTYSSQSQADQEVLVDITQSSANTEVAGAVLRCVDSTHYYYAVIGNTSGYVEIGKNIGGSFTQLVKTAFTSSFGTKYGLRFQVIGSTLKCRIWDASTTESTNWSAQATDTTLYTGGFGICTAPVGASSCKYDTFIATNGFTVSANPVPSAVGAEQTGLVAAALNADLVPAQDIGMYKTWSLQLDTVASGGTITFQGSNDGINYVTIYGYKAVDATLVTTATATGIYYGPRNYRYFRVRQTAWSSGATTGTLELYS